MSSFQKWDVFVNLLRLMEERSKFEQFISLTEFLNDKTY